MAQTSIILIAGLIFLIRYEFPESGVEFHNGLVLLWTFLITATPPILAYVTRKFTALRITILFEILSLVGFVCVIYLIHFPEYINRSLTFLEIAENSTELLYIIPFFVGLLCIHAVMHEVSRTRGEYLKFRFRLLLLPLIPFIIINIFLDIISLFPPLVAGILFVVLFIPLITLPHIIAPLLMQFLWKTVPLTDTVLKQKLEQLTEKSGIKYKDVAIWQTGVLSIANAAVAGIIPSNRKIFVTDALLRNFTEEQVGTIVAHEIGHIRHKHLPIFCILMVGYILCHILFYILIGTSLETLLGGSQLLISIVHILFFVLYFKIFLNFLSRKFEHQADLYAVELTKNPEAFKSALQHLSFMSTLPKTIRFALELFNTHPSIERRVRFLEKATDDIPSVLRYRKCLLEVKVFIALIPLLGVLIYMFN